MKTVWTEYDAETGLLTGVSGFGEYAGPLSFVEGRHDHTQSKVDLDTLAVVPYTPPPPLPPTMEEIENAILQRIQQHLDATAQSHGYDSMLSMISYLDSTVPTFAAEAAAGKAFRDAVWTYSNAQLAAVKSGTRTDIPTPDSFVQELPAMAWP